MKVYWLLEQLVHHRKTILQNCIISASVFEDRFLLLSLKFMNILSWLILLPLVFWPQYCYVSEFLTVLDSF